MVFEDLNEVCKLLGTIRETIFNNVMEKFEKRRNHEKTLFIVTYHSFPDRVQ
jgi:hypothetical protein